MGSRRILGLDAGAPVSRTCGRASLTHRRVSVDRPQLGHPARAIRNDAANPIPRSFAVSVSLLSLLLCVNLLFGGVRESRGRSLNSDPRRRTCRRGEAYSLGTVLVLPSTR